MSATLITDGSRRNAHGFTLIEIIAVLVVIGIMSAVAVTILSSLDRYRLDLPPVNESTFYVTI